MLQAEKAGGKENLERGHCDADANGILFNYGFPLGEVSCVLGKAFIGENSEGKESERCRLKPSSSVFFFA